MKDIRVFIQTEKFKGGPAIFRSRLIDALNNIDNIRVVTNVHDKFDIEIAFIRNIFPHNKPYILRVDGCYYEENRKSGNKSLVRAMKSARHLIFQSNFSFSLLDKVLQVKKMIKKRRIPYSIVHNGLNYDYIEKIPRNESIEPGSFISCSRWRPNKRPISTIKGFLKADTGRHLYMIGGGGIGGKKISKKYETKYIHILSEKKPGEIVSIMKSCDFLLHLCHIDSCPNTVIEALACGLNVLCTNLGGTPEIVKENGIILKADEMWPGKYLPKTNLDNLSRSMVAEGIHSILHVKKKEVRMDLGIEVVAQKYVDVIKSVV